jgi:hypothetical protein
MQADVNTDNGLQRFPTAFFPVAAGFPLVLGGALADTLAGAFLPDEDFAGAFDAAGFFFGRASESSESLPLIFLVSIVFLSAVKGPISRVQRPVTRRLTLGGFSFQLIPVITCAQLKPRRLSRGPKLTFAVSFTERATPFVVTGIRSVKVAL